MANGCPVCEAPEKQLWPPSSRAPQLETVEQGNWIILGACPRCGALWVEVPYEPYASFPYFVAWPRSRSEWRTIHDIDDGEALHRWHLARIRRFSTQFDADDREAVEWHRQRSYDRTPLHDPRLGDVAEPDLAALLSNDGADEPTE